MKLSDELLATLGETPIDELAAFHLLGREIASARIAANRSEDDPFEGDENDAIADVVRAVLLCERPLGRVSHLTPEVIVRNGMRAKFLGIDEGFWT